MPNNEDRNFGFIQPSDIVAATPVFVAVQLVFACLRDDVKWFLAALDDGSLAVVALSVVNDRARWQLVELDWLDSLKLDARGVPERIVEIECPICMKHVDVIFAGEKSIADVYTKCPSCGFQIDDIEQHLADVSGDGSDGEGGGTTGL